MKTKKQKMAATTSLVGGETKDQKQLQALRKAIVGKTLYKTQGKDYKNHRVKNAMTFLRERLDTQAKQSTKRQETFDYLEHHRVGGGGGGGGNVEAAKARLIAHYNGQDMCVVSSGRRQLKLPCADMKASQSDSNKGKVIGVCQVQSPMVEWLLQASNGVQERFLEELDRVVSAKPVHVAAHLCKRICAVESHVECVPHKVNKRHDFCAAWWLINGALVSFCQCSNAGKKCIRPGPDFDCDKFRLSLQSGLEGKESLFL